MDQWDIIMIAEQGYDLFGFPCTHEASINEDTSELLPNGFVQQDSDNGAINAAGQTTDHFAVPNLFTHGGNGLIFKACHCPIAGTADNIMGEVADQFGTVGRVNNFRVELNGVKFLFFVGNRRIGRAF